MGKRICPKCGSIKVRETVCGEEIYICMECGYIGDIKVMENKI